MRLSTLISCNAKSLKVFWGSVIHEIKPANSMNRIPWNFLMNGNFWRLHNQMGIHARISVQGDTGSDRQNENTHSLFNGTIAR